jgi:hypothetical protein
MMTTPRKPKKPATEYLECERTGDCQAKGRSCPHLGPHTARAGCEAKCFAFGNALPCRCVPVK